MYRRQNDKEMVTIEGTSMDRRSWYFVCSVCGTHSKLVFLDCKVLGTGNDPEVGRGPPGSSSEAMLKNLYFLLYPVGNIEMF